MDWQMLLYLVPYLASLAISIGVGVYAWRRRAAPGVTAYAISTFGAVLWTLGFILELLNPTLAGKIFWDNVQFIAAFLVPVGGTMFVLEYSGRKPAYRQRVWLLLLIIPILSMVLIFTDAWHHLIRPTATLVPRQPAPELDYDFTATVLSMAAYLYGLTLFNLLLLLNHLLRQQRLYRIQTGLILLGFLLPFLGSLLTLLDIRLGPYRDIFPLTSGFGNLLVAWGLFRFQIFDLLPVAREAVVESMRDLVLVLDQQNRVIDINPAALKLLQRQASDVIGQPTAQVFSNWPDLVEQFQEVDKAQVEVAADFPDGRRYFDLHLSPLSDQFGQRTGRLVVARDITDYTIAQAELRTAHAELEQRVQERTVELSNANVALRSEMTERQRIEEFLRQNEAKYRTLFESASDAIFVMQGEQIVDCNARTLSIFGCERQQILGQSPVRFSPAHQPDGEASQTKALEKISQALNGEPQFFQWLHCRYDDTRFEAEVSLNRIDLDQKPFLLAIVRDVTERQHAAAEKTRLLYDLNERVKELTALHAVMQKLQHDQGTVAELLQQIVTLLPAAWQYPEITAVRLRFAGEEAQTENFSTTPWRQQTEFASAKGDHGAIEVVYLAERPLAAEGPFLAEERHLINSLAEMLRSHLDRKQSEQALQKSEERFALAAQATNEGLWDRDLITGEIYVSPRWESLLGFKAGQYSNAGSTFEELIHPDDWPLLTQTQRDRFAGSASHYEVEFRIRHTDGAYRWFLSHALIVRDPAGRPVRLVGAHRDITDRHQAEAARQQRVQELAGLYEIAQAFSTLTDARETYGVVVERLAVLIGARRGVVMLSNEQGILIAQAPGHGLPAEWFQTDEVFSRLLPRGWGVVSNEIFLANTLADFPESLRPMLRGRGLENALAVPLLIEQTLLGSVVLLDKPGGFTTHDSHLLGVVAAQAAVIIHNAQLYEAEHKARVQTDALLGVARTVSASLSLHEVMLRILRESARVLPFISGSLTIYENGVPTLMALAGHAGREEAVMQIAYEDLKDSPILRRLLVERKPQLIADVAQHPDWVTYPETAYIRSWIGVPLIAHDQVIGVLALDSDEVQKFKTAEVATAQALAAQAAIAIENAQLFTAEQTAREQAEVLRAASAAITQSLDVSTVLETILEHMHRLVPYDSASVFLVENKTQLIIRAARGYEQWTTPAEHYRGMMLDSSTTPNLHTVITTQASLLIPDTHDYAGWAQIPGSEFVRNWIGVPLITGGRIIGVYSLDKAIPNFFTQIHLRLAEVLSAQGTVAIQNARLFEAEQRSIARMEILHEIDRAILAARSPEAIASATLSRIRKLAPVQRAQVILIDEGAGQATVLAISVNGETQYEAGRRLSLADLHPQALSQWRQGQPHVVTNLLELDPHTAIDEILLAAGMRSRVSVPMLARNQLIGALVLHSQKQEAFSAEHIEIASEVADQLAIAIQQARLLTETTEALAREERLNAVAQTISGTLDLPTLLETVVRLAAELVGAEAGILGLVSPDGERIDAPYAFNLPPALDSLRSLPKGQGIAWRIVATRQPVLLSDYESHPNALPDWVASGVHGFIGVPVMAGETVLGSAVLISLTSDHRFMERDLILFEAVGRQAGVAIQNARLFEQVSAGREQLQTLSRRLVEVQEEERRHLARELHDEVGQMLTGLKLMLGIVPRLPSEKVGSQINEVLTVLNRLTERVHDLSLDLRPMMLDDLGLTSALLWLFDRFTAQSGVRVNFESVGLEERLPAEVETTTYRLIQEALTNVARYAETDEALVRLRADGTQLRLQIQDAGRGFDTATVLTSVQQRVGLAGMKERVALLGGWFQIESAPGAGTQITAALPLQGRLERRRHDRLNFAGG